MVVHVGTNDIGRCLVDLENRYRMLLRKKRESGRICMLLGILLKLGSSSE